MLGRYQSIGDKKYFGIVIISFKRRINIRSSGSSLASSHISSCFDVMACVRPYTHYVNSVEWWVTMEVQKIVIQQATSNIIFVITNIIEEQNQGLILIACLKYLKTHLFQNRNRQLRYIDICFPRFFKNISVSVSIGNQNNSILDSQTAGVYDSRVPLQLLASGCEIWITSFVVRTDTKR